MYLAILWLLSFPFSPSNYFHFATFFLHFFSVETTWFKSASIFFPFCFAVYLRYLKWVIMVFWAFLNGRGPVATSRMMWVLYSPRLSSDDKWLVYCQSRANTYPKKLNNKTWEGLLFSTITLKANLTLLKEFRTLKNML